MLFLPYSIIFYHHMLTHYMHVLFPLLFYILTVSLSDDLGFAHSDIRCFYFIDQVYDETDMLRGDGVSLYLFCYYCLFISVDYVVSLILYTLLSVVIPFLYPFDIMCGHSYIVLQLY